MKQLIERLELVERSGAKRMDKIRAIVADESMGKVDGLTMDLTTANMLVKIYDAIKDPKMKEKFSSLPVKKMVAIGWSLIK